MIKSKYREYKSLKTKEKQLKEDINKLQTKFSEKLSDSSENPFLNFYSALGDDQNRIIKKCELREISSKIGVIRFQVLFFIVIIFAIITVIIQCLFLL